MATTAIALALLAHEPADKVVLDLEDPPFVPAAIEIDVAPPALPRVPTEQLTMHVYVEGCWHRRMPDLSATSCDVQYNAQFAPTRREELVGELCSDCFTPAELVRAWRANKSGPGV